MNCEYRDECIPYTGAIDRDTNKPLNTMHLAERQAHPGAPLLIVKTLLTVETRPLGRL